MRKDKYQIDKLQKVTKKEIFDSTYNLLHINLQAMTALIILFFLEAAYDLVTIYIYIQTCLLQLRGGMNAFTVRLQLHK